MQREYQRVAIVNRGEAAMRFIHAAREFNHEHGASLRTIALFTDPDHHAMFVREADEAVPLGPAQIFDPQTHHLKSCYVDYAHLERALARARAEAVWVGWGFVAEHAAFADLCRDLDIVFIGPDGDVMRRLGDKISSKLLAEQAQVPTAPWSGGPIDTLTDARHHADRLGYPLLIKATAGGGGHGIRRVHAAGELAAAFEGARAEAFKAFGDPTVFMEQLVTGARHVEVQIIADHHGTTWAVGVRDCTIQRRHQKVLEEAPSPALTTTQDTWLREAAVRLSEAAGYRNAGTVEFLYEPKHQRFIFMEMNTRLQVEHPVTECTTGLDLVKLQIHVARGGALEGDPPRSSGHAIEVRLNAEDPDNAFAPSPGRVDQFRIITGPGVRVDTGVAEGDCVPPQFDSMIAKIIAYGVNRSEALSRLRRALRESVIVIKGGTSNRSFLVELLARPEVQSSDVDIGWLDRLAVSGEHLSRTYADIAVAHAAIEAYDAELAVEQAQFYASALRGRPQVRSDVGRAVELRYRGHSYLVNVCRLALQRYRVTVDGSHIDAEVERLGKFEYWFTSSGKRFHLVSSVEGLSHRIEVDGFSHRVDRDDGGVVHASAPAVVVSVAVKPGDTVSIGDRLVVLEAMKMETQVVAPFSGRVRQVMAIPNVQVNAGAPLLRIEPTAGAGESSRASDRLVFGSSLSLQPAAQAEQQSWREKLEEVRRLTLGFDVQPARSTGLLADWSRLLVSSADREELRHSEDEILSIFVDICSLFRRNPKINDLRGVEASSTESYLFSYLRMLDTHGDGLPPEFMSALWQAVTHYGIATLDRSPELEEALLRIYKSHQRAEQQVAPILAILQRRLADMGEGDVTADESLRTLLDRMVWITRAFFPTVSDLARELRYRCFDQPLFEQGRKQIYAAAEEHLDYLANHPSGEERHERVRALLECPQLLAGLFSARIQAADNALRELMLEVVTTRYYRGFTLTNFRGMAAGSNSCISAEYEDEKKRVHVFATHCQDQEFAEALHSVSALLKEVAAGDPVVLDVHLWNSGQPVEPEAARQQLHSLLNQVSFPCPIERVVVILSARGQKKISPDIQHFTFVMSGDAYEEDAFFRGVHPVTGRRLHLWRLKNFKTERLPSAEDIYLLHAVALDNPKDERLFAVAEIRDLTPVRNKAGRIVQLPHLERMFAEALAAMRQFQSRRSQRERLLWNRIFLYVWPPIDLKPDEFKDIVHKLAPSTDGAGLEQVVVRARIPNPRTGDLRDTIIRISAPGDAGILMTFRPASKLQPMKQLSDYDQKVVRMRQRGLLYPYQIISMLTPDRDDTRAEFSPGAFQEYDFDTEGRFAPVDRPYGHNRANIIVGIISNFTPKYPEGMTRVLLLGDLSRDMGALAEAECSRIIAALDLAERIGVPIEWFPFSSGAKISMDSGVENLDWTARVLRRLITFTQAGGEVNLVVNGINVGAQSYWNAEATMLMHTRGILIMTPKAAMVLTGKRALDYSGSVSADDNQGIGGYERIMGLNGQAQYFARNIHAACQILMRHYEHTYVGPGERFPRNAGTADPIDRDVQLYPHPNGGENGFARVGEIFSDKTNPGRKKSFDIRNVMKAVVDQDHSPLERWSGMQSAEMAVVWDAHLGGAPVCLVGIESKPLPRLGFVPADGSDQWTAGTLFPLSSKKVARAINAASNNRPVVVLANLSGFDGSPESMRKLQLEYGAEIGRAVVNFKGPMIFCVISRYHGGAYVVFSRALNEQLEVVALEGSYASVIGGAPAAGVVFAGEVEARTRKDPRIQTLSDAMLKAEGIEKSRLRDQWNEAFNVVHSEKLGEVAAEFDRIHSVHRALEVGSLHNIIPPSRLRPYLIHAVERGMLREEQALADKRSEHSSAKEHAPAEHTTLFVGSP